MGEQKKNDGWLYDPVHSGERIEVGAGGGGPLRLLWVAVGVEDHPVGYGSGQFREPTVGEVLDWLRERVKQQEAEQISGGWQEDIWGEDT